MGMPDIPGIEAAVQSLLDQEAVELVDLRYLQEGGRWILRFYLDKAGGVTLDDCEYLSGRIGGLLDTTDLMPGRYALEVSSPGVDRVLKKERDFLRFMGHRAKVRLKDPREGRRKFAGYIKSYQGGAIVLEDGERTLSLPMADVEEARLDPELEV